MNDNNTRQRHSALMITNVANGFTKACKPSMRSLFQAIKGMVKLTSFSKKMRRPQRRSHKSSSNIKPFKNAFLTSIWYNGHFWIAQIATRVPIEVALATRANAFSQSMSFSCNQMGFILPNWAISLSDFINPNAANSSFPRKNQSHVFFLTRVASFPAIVCCKWV